MYICITCTYRFATALKFCLSSQNYSSAAVAGTCNVVKSNLLKSSQESFLSKSSQESQKLVTGVRLESTINTVIEGIHVHRSVKLFLVLLRGLRGAPQSLATARTPHARPSLCPRKIPAGTRGGPVPASQFTRGASFRTRGGLELLAAGSVYDTINTKYHTHYLKLLSTFFRFDCFISCYGR